MSVLRSPAREWCSHEHPLGSDHREPHRGHDWAPQEESGPQGLPAVDGVAVHLDTESRLLCGSSAVGFVGMFAVFMVIAVALSLVGGFQAADRGDATPRESFIGGGRKSRYWHSHPHST